MADCADVDRITPTKRPDREAAGTQRWRELLFVHWSFEAEAVRKLVPASFDLDLWQGRAWVGMVPFRMEATRTSWMPKRTGLEFLETNLRTYVLHQGEPGVFFFSLEAASWLAVRAARLMWGLPYFHADMHATREGQRVSYQTKRRSDERTPGVDVTYDVGDALGPSMPGTLQHFLLERYYLFCEKQKRVLKGHVNHVPYPARAATIDSLRQDLTLAAGLPDNGKLETVHFSEGVEVEVFGPDVVANVT